MITVKGDSYIPTDYTGLVILTEFKKLLVVIDGINARCPYPDTDHWSGTDATAYAWIGFDDSEFYDWLKVFYETFKDHPILGKEIMNFMLGNGQ